MNRRMIAVTTRPSGKYLDPMLCDWLNLTTLTFAVKRGKRLDWIWRTRST